MIPSLKKVIASTFIASLTINSLAVEREPGEVNDLRYGEALYHFYKEQYFTSITNLMVAKHRNPISTQGVEPVLRSTSKCQ